jgi:hypothetical protein
MAATTAALIEAYKASNADFLAVAEHPPIEPLDPRLANHTAGKQLETVRSGLTQLAIQGRAFTGTVSQSSFHLKEFTGTAAVLEVCEIDGGVEIDVHTGRVILPAPTAPNFLNVRLDLVSGAWKVTDSSTVRSGCV